MVSGFVDPVEEADDKADQGDQEGKDQVNDGDIELAVHAVVEGRDGTS